MKITTSRKTSGYVDEITGIANHAIMQSRLRETLGTFAVRRPAPQAERL
jgi:hypothetical protein